MLLKESQLLLVSLLGRFLVTLGWGGRANRASFNLRKVTCC